MDDDPQYDFLEILKKIESNVNYLTEAREHLNKVQRYKLKDKNSKTAIEHSENVHKADERKEKQKQNALLQKEAEEAAKLKQAEKTELIKNMQKPMGKRDQARSQKKRFKPVVKK